MRVIVQRSKESSVSIDGKVVGKIDKGLVVLVGFTQGDTIKDIEYIVRKIVNLRIFDDENGVMNKSILDIGGQVLSISQFTLYANPYEGNRPSYICALNGNEATLMYDDFNQKLGELVPLEKGVFGADMLVNIQNDGPITITIDSAKPQIKNI